MYVVCEMHPFEERYRKIKENLDKIIENSTVDADIAVPAIFVHALTLAKMREKKNA